MSFYTKHILPWRLSRSMDNQSLEQDRQWVASHAHETVLEIGFGSGLNLPFYTGVTKLYALDPAKEFFAYAKPLIQKVRFPVEHLCVSAEAIPLPNSSVDAVVSTWSLCSIPNPDKALSEISRVLKPEGVFVFAEHGKSPRPFAYFLQKITTPFTKRYDGNCHLDRDIPALIGTYFTIKDLVASPEKWKPLNYDYRGIAFRKP